MRDSGYRVQLRMHFPSSPHPASCILLTLLPSFLLAYRRNWRLVLKLDQSLTDHYCRLLWMRSLSDSRSGQPARCCASRDSPPWHVRKHPWPARICESIADPETKSPVRTASTARHTVTVNVGEVLPLLADAVASQRTWLSDFEDDEITISADLYEVLLAYQYYRHPAA